MLAAVSYSYSDTLLRTLLRTRSFSIMAHMRFSPAKLVKINGSFGLALNRAFVCISFKNRHRNTTGTK